MTGTPIALVTGATAGLGRAVAGALADHNAIALLINNAGMGAGRAPYRRRQLSADGHELRLAVNYLAPAYSPGG